MQSAELFTLVLVHSPNQEGLKEALRKRISRVRVFWFVQDELPAFDLLGKLVVERRNNIVVEQNGLGGIVRQLLASGLVPVLWLQ